MPLVITDGNTKIGAYKFTGRKKPCICVEKMGSITSYGSFHDEEDAEKFITELGKFIGATFECKLKYSGESGNGEK